MESAQERTRRDITSCQFEKSIWTNLTMLFYTQGMNKIIYFYTFPLSEVMLNAN